MRQRGSRAQARRPRPAELPLGSGKGKSPKRSVEATIRRVAVGTACAVLALYVAVTRNWDALLGALCAAAAVSLTLVPLFWLLNNPKPGAPSRAVPEER